MAAREDKLGVVDDNAVRDVKAERSRFRVEHVLRGELVGEWRGVLGEVIHVEENGTWEVRRGGLQVEHLGSFLT